MLLSDIVKNLNLTPRVEGLPDREVAGGYCSDLLSDVLGNAKSGTIWVTNQKHQNCIAVASLLGIAAVVIAGGVEPDENTIEKAVAEQIPLFTSGQQAFDVVGELYQLGVRGI